MNAESHLRLTAACDKMTREHQIAIEGLTEKQVAEAIKQAVIAGDFQVNVLANPPSGTHSQSVVYLPGRGVDELREKVERMAKCIQVVRDVVFSTECVSSCARNDRCSRCKLADALNELDCQTGGEA